jgi:hypothetical protein
MDVFQAFGWQGSHPAMWASDGRRQTARSLIIAIQYVASNLDCKALRESKAGYACQRVIAMTSISVIMPS